MRRWRALGNLRKGRNEAHLDRPAVALAVLDALVVDPTSVVVIAHMASLIAANEVARLDVRQELVALQRVVVGEASGAIYKWSVRNFSTPGV